MAASTIGIFLLLIAHSMCNPREILIDEENPSVNANSFPIDDDDDYIQKVPCHMEYQVVKKVIGTCVKLGSRTRGCVAGNYLHPLHPECM